MPIRKIATFRIDLITFPNYHTFSQKLNYYNIIFDLQDLANLHDNVS